MQNERIISNRPVSAYETVLLNKTYTNLRQAISAGTFWGCGDPRAYGVRVERQLLVLIVDNREYIMSGAITLTTILFVAAIPVSVEAQVINQDGIRSTGSSGEIFSRGPSPQKSNSDMKKGISDSPAISSNSSGHFEEDRRTVAIDVYKKMMGGKGLDAAVAEADSNSIMAPLNKLILDFGMGEMWSRPGFDFRDKSLITLSLDVATRSFPELKSHIKIALRNGLTVEQIRDLFIHSILYVGFPAVVEAHKVLLDVIKEEGIEKDKIQSRP